MIPKTHFFRRFCRFTFVIMKRASKRIIISSERVNGFRFRVLTDGIDLAQFENNPIMLWMHRRAWGEKEDDILPLGNVIELKRETHPEFGKVITGLPVFDDTDEFAMRIYKKYENGTIRMASAGLRPVEWSDATEYLLPGQQGATLLKSVLEEVSLCDIGSNDDALQVALYNDSSELIQLSATGENAAIPLIKNPLIENQMLKIELTAAKAAAILGEKEIATVDQFETKVAEVVQLAARQKAQIETLTREKQEAEQKLEESNKVQLAAKIETMVQEAVDQRKITADEKSQYVKLAAADYEAVETLLKSKVGAEPIATKLAKGVEDKDALVKLCAKSFDELFEDGELEKVKLSAPEEYKRIYKAKFGKEPK